MRCLILGGGGFLGSHLADALLDEGHAVRILDRPNLVRYRPFRPDEPLEWIEGDFLDERHLDAAVEGCDAVYHLVSTTLPRSSNENPAYDVQTNVMGTLRLLESVRRHRAGRVVLVSSGGTVYGIPRSIPIPETHPTEPLCAYGIGKLAIEKYLHLHHHLHGLDYRVLRLANPFGERQRVSAAQGAVTVFLDRALRGDEIEIWGDGSVIRDYFHVSDAVSAMTRALRHEGKRRIFNIGSGTGLSLNQLIAAIERLVGTTVHRRHRPARPFDVAVSVLDTSLAREDLGWTPKVTFAEGLARTARWLVAEHARAT